MIDNGTKMHLNIGKYAKGNLHLKGKKYTATISKKHNKSTCNLEEEKIRQKNIVGLLEIKLTSALDSKTFKPVIVPPFPHRASSFEQACLLPFSAFQIKAIFKFTMQVRIENEAIYCCSNVLKT